MYVHVSACVYLYVLANLFIDLQSLISISKFSHIPLLCDYVKRECLVWSTIWFIRFLGNPLPEFQEILLLWHIERLFDEKKVYSVKPDIFKQVKLVSYSQIRGML